MSKSTGPRTPRGKARSSQNAAKHWIESGRILSWEQDQASSLRCELMNDFKPDGVLEREIIDDIVLARLIKRRIDIAFTREFTKASIKKVISSTENAERAVTEYWLRHANLRGPYGSRPELAERLRPAECIAGLEGLIGRIADRGPRPQDLELLRQYFGDQPTEQGAFAMSLLLPVVTERSEEDTAHDSVDEDQVKEEVVAALQIEIERQRDREKLEIALDSIESAPNHPQEPPDQTLETLLRYQTANRRELKDLLGIFESARRIRLGE